MKKCTKCGRELPATSEYFAPSKLGRQGLRAECRECRVPGPSGVAVRRIRKKIEVTLSDTAREALDAMCAADATSRSRFLDGLILREKKKRK